MHKSTIPKSEIPVISIICTTYNHAEFISVAIESFLMQETSYPFEILIYDDASTDGTAEKIREYETKYPHLIFPICQNENQFSKGVKVNQRFQYPRARGKYIALCEGDDYWTDPGKLQKQVKYLESHPELSFCFHEVEKRDTAGTLIERYNKVTTEKIHTVTDLCERNFIATCSVVFRNNPDVMSSVFDTLPTGDWGLNVINAQQGNFVYLPDCMGVYRIHPGGRWSSLPRDLMGLLGIETMMGLDRMTNRRYIDKFAAGIKKRMRQFMIDESAVRRNRNELLPETYATCLQMLADDRKRAAVETSAARGRWERAGVNKPKIAVIQSGFPVYSATFILDQITGLIDRGFDVENWATYKPTGMPVHATVEKYDLMRKTRYLRLPSEGLKQRPREWVKAFVSRNDIQDADQYDAFHVHYGLNYNLLEPLFLQTDAFVLVSFHGHDASRYIDANGPDCYRSLFNRANMITTPSRHMKERLIELGCDPDLIRIHRYGVDTSRFRPDWKKQDARVPILLTVGRLVEKKGIIDSISAFEKIARETDAEYRIIGDGALKEKIEKTIRESGLEGRVILLGAKDKDEVQKEMKNADAFVLTSRTAADGDMEGLPVSLIEAHAAGLPVISTRHSGIPELVEEGKTGLLSDEGDIQDIAGSMLRLLSDQPMRERFSTAARGKIRKVFNIETLNDALGEILGMGAGPGAARRLLKGRLKSRNWEYKFKRYRDAFSHMNIMREVDQPALSIVIISWRLHPLTLQNLELLEKQRDRNFELIFVDNGGNDGEFDSLYPYIDTYIKLGRNTGAYLARNIGALFANAPVLLFLEDDGIPSETLVEAHARLHERYNIIAARGVYRAREDSPYLRFCAHYDLGAAPFPIYADLEGNTSYRADVFFAAGGWDDDIEFGGGGVDLAIRLLELDPDRRKQIYSPDPVLHHEYAKSSEHLSEKRRKQALSHRRLLKKHPMYADHLNGWREYLGRADAIPVRHGNGKSYGDPMVSVCIPTYNRAGFLKEAVESVLRQDYANFEIVVVDDGSEDRTAETVGAFRSDKIRYFRNETNSGRPFSRNRCIEESNGNYILWLDDDDLLEPHTLRRYAERISSTGGMADVLYGNLKMIGADGRETGRLLVPTDYTGKGNMLIVNILTGGGTLLPNPGSMVKKSLYERHGGYRNEYPRAQDADLWLRIADTATFYKLNETVAMYREHENNISLGACIDTTYESRIIIELMQCYGLRTLAGVLKLQNDRDVFFTILAKRFYEFRNYAASHRILTSIKNGRLIRQDYPILCLSLLGMGRYRELEQLLDTYGDMLEPADRDKYTMAAESYARLEEYREKPVNDGIVAHARSLADVSGMNCDVAYVLARAYENDGRYTDAYRCARTAFQSYPAESLYYGLYYKLARCLKKEDEAAAMLRRISETSAYIDTCAGIFTLWNNGETAEELNRQAEKHIEAGDTGNARDLILSALQKDVDNADYLNNLAVVEIMDKHYQTAALLLKQIIERDPAHESALQNLEYLTNLVPSGTIQ